MNTFRVTYDGPALEASEMDVRELAPALLAIGDVLDASATALYGGRIKAQVNVRGSFKTGSFGIDVSLLADWATRVRDLLAGDAGTATANALAILTALGWVSGQAAKVMRPSLFEVLRWLRGRAISKVDVNDETAILHVDEERIEIELRVLTLLRDVPVRRAAERVLAPLARDGVEVVAFGDDRGRVAVEVKRDELPWFVTPPVPDELLVNEERRMVFSIVSLAFKDDNKWRLYDGSNTIHATISDADFLARVDANQESFSKGDVLICEVRVQQWQTFDGAKTDYEVVRVVEHRTASRQIALPGV
jgi:hypothetical protein